MPGVVVDLDALYSLAKKYKVKVIEDASNVMGAKYKGKFIGNSGADITIFSFAPHLCNSVVSGGMLVTNDKGIHERGQSLLSFHGNGGRRGLGDWRFGKLVWNLIFIIGLVY